MARTRRRITEPPGGSPWLLAPAGFADVLVPRNSYQVPHRKRTPSPSGGAAASASDATSPHHHVDLPCRVLTTNRRNSPHFDPKRRTESRRDPCSFLWERRTLTRTQSAQNLGQAFSRSADHATQSACVPNFKPTRVAKIILASCVPFTILPKGFVPVVYQGKYNLILSNLVP